MANFDTTATCQEDAYIDSSASSKDTNFNTGSLIINGTFATASGRVASLLNWRLPDKPIGADKINRVTLVLSVRSNSLTAFRVNAFKSSANWVEAQVSSYKRSTGNAWVTEGGDKTPPEIGGVTIPVLAAQGGSFSCDVTNGDFDWAGNGNCFLTTATNVAAAIGVFFSTEYTGATTAWKPHIVVNYADNPPDGVRDLMATPDYSLTEASFTRQQRALLTWSPSSAVDFGRYRLRRGVERSLPANMSHLAFLSSAASTSYIDTTIPTDGTAVYYALYVEDQNNRSASTNANVSNVASWRKPRQTDLTTSPVTLEVLQEYTASLKMPEGDLRQAKFRWGDGSYSFSKKFSATLASTIEASHRFSKATTFNVYVHVEDARGFRSSRALDAQAVTSPAPVSRIVAVPSTQRTATAFSAGVTPGSSSTNTSDVLGITLDTSNPVVADGVMTRFRCRASTLGDGIMDMQLWRPEGSYYRLVYADRAATIATAAVTVGRDINWRVKRGDLVGHAEQGLNLCSRYSDTAFRYYRTSASYFSAGTRFPRYAFEYKAGAERVTIAGFTNPVRLSAKDSFARGATRVINRFRWVPSWAGGTMPVTNASYYTTGATSSYYFYSTAATTAFVLVRTVDDTHASSSDFAGIVFQTEATFRIPNDLRDGVKNISDNRSRGFTLSRAVGRDYGYLDIGSIDPVILTASGKSYTLGTANTWIDIDRLSAAFQQRKRIYVIPPWSTSTAAQGYIVEPPFVHDAGEPVFKKWSVKIAVSQV